MPAVEHPEATTTAGRVRGEPDRRGGAVFRGIPYATPPTGELRWRAPRPPAPWAGVREAVAFGPAAPQPTGGPLGGLVPDMEPSEHAEDCLTLNVWTPACDTAARPVLVWLHGGAFSIGAGSLPTYDAADLAANEDVVVVTCNYRLGALGYLLLDLPGTEANVGLLDQLAVLAWVRDNVAAFGGDPQRVTLFGESAGAGSVLSVLSAPGAHGLLHAAIVQSGATDLVLSREQALVVTATIATELGIDRDDVGAWRRAPVDALLAAQASAAGKLFATVGMMPLHPVADGAVMAGTWQDVAARGDAANVPLIIGTTRDEMALFGAMDQSAATLDDAALARRLTAIGATDPAHVVAAHRATEPGASPAAIWSACTTDRAMWLPAIRYAEAYARYQPATWMYRFDWPSSVPGLGACHAVDIPFPFDAVGRNGWEGFVTDPPAAHTLARSVQALWAAFARTGAPAAPAHGVPDWPRYATGPSTSPRATLVLDRVCHLEHDPRAAVRELWS